MVIGINWSQCWGSEWDPGNTFFFGHFYLKRVESYRLVEPDRLFFLSYPKRVDLQVS